MGLRVIHYTSNTGFFAVLHGEPGVLFRLSFPAVRAQSERSRPAIPGYPSVMVALLLLIAAQELRLVLRSFLPLPSYLLLWGASRVPALHFDDHCALLRENSWLYNYVTESVRAALIDGVFCPGIGQAAGGALCFDTGATTLEARVQATFGVSSLDRRDLAPLVAECNGSVMASWHCRNSDTPAWLCLSSFLTDRRSGCTFAYYCAPDGRRFFVAYILILGLRLALVFRRGPPVVIELD